MSAYKFEIFYKNKTFAKIYGEKIAAFTTYNDAVTFFDDYCSIIDCAIREINGGKFPTNNMYQEFCMEETA